MSLNFTEEQVQIRDMVRKFAEAEIRPIAAEIDRTGRFPREIFTKLGELGVLGLPIPEAFGGAGAGTVAFILALEEIAKVCASTALGVAAHVTLCCGPITYFGTDAQKRKYLPDLASGKKLGAFGLTEPGAGSDAAATETTAVRKGDHYVVNGRKFFCTNASVAGTYVFTAVTDKAKKANGISSFIIEAGAKGFKVGKKEDKIGLRGSDTCELIFEDAIVPAENLLGEEGLGFKNFMKTLDGGRIGIGAFSLGIAEAALAEAIKYSKQRHQFGKPISEFQSLRFMMADMATEIEASRQLVYHAASLKDAGRPTTTESAMAKLFASETAVRCCDKAVQIHGGYGLIKEFPVERLYRDVKLCTIGEGTSEIQRLVISRQILG